MGIGYYRKGGGYYRKELGTIEWSYRLGASYYGVGTDYEMGLVYIR